MALYHLIGHLVVLYISLTTATTQLLCRYKPVLIALNSKQEDLLLEESKEDGKKWPMCRHTILSSSCISWTIITGQPKLLSPVLNASLNLNIKPVLTRNNRCRDI